MYSVIDIPELPEMGFPIQKSPAQCLFSGSPKLIAAYHVFHRHPVPRHPPSALNSLAINFAIYAIEYTILGTFVIKFLCQYSVFKEQHTTSNWAISSKLKIHTYYWTSGFQPVATIWWRWTGSNRWPPACKAGALPSELHPHFNWRLNIEHFFLLNNQFSIVNRNGGPSWNWTNDLTLIRRAL